MAFGGDQKDDYYMLHTKEHSNEQLGATGLVVEQLARYISRSPRESSRESLKLDWDYLVPTCVLGQHQAFQKA